MSPELLKKWRLRPEVPIHVLGMPLDCSYLFDDFRVLERLEGETSVAQLIVFARNSSELAGYVPLMAPYVAASTLVWIIYPKKSGRIKDSDLIYMPSWDVLFTAGYRGQTAISINDDWTGIRVTTSPPTHPNSHIVPQHERKIEGIDFITRQVTLPDDALAYMNRYTGLVAYFYAQSFTFKKECVVSLIDAKKAETRQRRVEKITAALLQQMTAQKK